MYPFFCYEELAKENRRSMEKEVQHCMLVMEAQLGSSGHQGSKTLVKLGKLLIQAGEWIMAHAERDIPSTFPGVTLQNY